MPRRPRAAACCCIIGGAGGAAHPPGMLAAKTVVPVLGVPVTSRHLRGLDSLLSIAQMPKGVPVATFAVGEAGAANAALFAVAMLACDDARLANEARRLPAPADRRSAGDEAAQAVLKRAMIFPDAMLGMLGGGQLGRMFTLAAHGMG